MSSGLAFVAARKKGMAFTDLRSMNQRAPSIQWFAGMASSPLPLARISAAATAPASSAWERACMRER